MSDYEKYLVVCRIQFLFWTIDKVTFKYSNPHYRCSIASSNSNCGDYCWSYASFFDVFQVASTCDFKEALYNEMCKICSGCGEWVNDFEDYLELYPFIEEDNVNHMKYIEKIAYENKDSSMFVKRNKKKKLSILE